MEGGTSTSALGQRNEQPEHRVAINEHLVDNTKKAFLTNPAFDDSNPRAEKNKETYINNLVGQGFDKSMLLKTSKEVSDNKKLLVESTEKLNGKTVYDPFNKVEVKIKEGNPNDHTATYDAGTALLALGKTDDAIAMFNSTLAKIPQQNQEQQFVQSQDARDIQMNVIPANNPANSLFGIGAALSKQGKYKESVDAYNEALQASGNDKISQANINKGLAYSTLKLGNKDASKEYIKQARILEEENKPSEGLTQQIGEEATALKKQEAESNRIKDIADGLESLATGRPVGKMDAGFLGYLVNPVGKWVAGIQEAGATIGEGLKEMAESQQYDILKSAGKKSTIKEMQQGRPTMVGGALTTVEGGASTAFAAMPEITIFNAGIAGTKEAAKLLPKNIEGAVNEALDLPFSAVSLFGNSLGYNPDEKSDAAKLMKLGDIVGSFATMAGIHKGVGKIGEKVESIKNMNDFQQSVDKLVRDNNIKEIEKINVFSDYVKNLKLDNIKLALEKDNTPEAKAILDDIKKKQENVQKQEARDSELKTIQSKRAELGQAEDILSIPTNVSSVIDRISTGKPTDPIALTEAKTHLFNEYKRLQELKSDNNRMFTIEQINDAQEMLHKAAAEIDTYQHNERVVSPELKELQDKKDKLEEDKNKMDATNPGSSIIIQPKIDAIDVQIQNVASVDSSVHHEAAADAVRLGEIDDQVTALEESKKGLSQESQDEIDKHITNLNTEKDAIQKPSTERNVPLPGATGETITESGEGVRQGIKGDEVAKEGEEKVAAQTEDLEELDFLKLKDDNGTATESEKNRIAELEQKINPTEKPIEKAKLSTIKEPSEKVVEPTQKEHTKESTHTLVKNYNELSYREKQSKEGQELKAKIGEAIKDLGYSLKSRAKGKFSLLDEKGVEYRRKAIVREASEIQKEKQAKKRKKSLLNRAPDSVEEAVLQDIANGVRFDKKEFTEITGLSGDDIPLGLLKEGGKRIEEYNQNVAERQGNLEDYGDTDMQQMSKIADTISEYATNDRRERAYKALDEMEQRRINHGMTDKELEHYIENQKLSYLEESDVDEILHSVDFMTDKEIESLIKDIEESETDIEKETKIQEHENEIRKPSEQEEISGVNAKNKKQSIKEGEKETLKNVVADKKAKMQSAENKYQKAKAELEKKGQEDQINIFGETPGEAKLFKEDLSASKKVVENYKNEYLDAKKEYEKSQKDLDNYVEPNQLSISEQAKVIADNIRKGKIDGTMTAPPLLKQAWNGGLELAAKAIEAGGTVTEAIAKAIEHFKNSDYYKSLSESGKKRLVEHLEETLDANKSKEHKLFDRIDELSKDLLSNEDRAEIKKIYQENPKVEEINRNFKKIISQLEGTEEFKKSDGCP